MSKTYERQNPVELCCGSPIGTHSSSCTRTPKQPVRPELPAHTELLKYPEDVVERLTASLLSAQSRIGELEKREKWLERQVTMHSEIAANQQWHKEKAEAERDQLKDSLFREKELNGKLRVLARDVLNNARHTSPKFDKACGKLLAFLDGAALEPITEQKG